jgi:hypothetical protein
MPLDPRTRAQLEHRRAVKKGGKKERIEEYHKRRK